MQKMKMRDILERAIIYLSFIINDSFKDAAFIVVVIVLKRYDFDADVMIEQMSDLRTRFLSKISFEPIIIKNWYFRIAHA